MREGTNMGIMTTLKKPTLESLDAPLGDRACRLEVVALAAGILQSSRRPIPLVPL